LPSRVRLDQPLDDPGIEEAETAHVADFERGSRLGDAYRAVHQAELDADPLEKDVPEAVRVLVSGGGLPHLWTELAPCPCIARPQIAVGRQGEHESPVAPARGAE
jgi:hypothetical protein